MHKVDVALLTQAANVVGQRQAIYGSPAKDFERVASLWSVIFGIQVKPEQVPMAMICLKLSRMVESYHQDNALDICGYAQCHEALMQEMFRRDDADDARKQIAETA